MHNTHFYERGGAEVKFLDKLFKLKKQWYAKAIKSLAGRNIVLAGQQ